MTILRKKYGSLLLTARVYRVQKLISEILEQSPYVEAEGRAADVNGTQGKKKMNRED